MNDNPYEAPRSHIPLHTDRRLGQPVPAGKGVRFLNLIIDYAAFFGFSVVVGAGIGLSGSRDLLRLIEEHERVAGIVLLLAYYVIMEGLFARSVGKLITGCKVVNEQGERPSFLQVLGRTFARLIPFEGFSFLGNSGRGLHDSIAKTYVVKCR